MCQTDKHQASNYQSACDFLSAIDTDWADLITHVGACTMASELEVNLSPYQALVQAVAYQQLHAKAGDAIFAKFKQHFSQNGQSHFPTPEQLAVADYDDLRACGFSGRKIETIQGIANAAINGLIPTLNQANEMTDDALIAQLTTLKGIGQWTVEMMLIFTLQRWDILPVTDFGVVEGYKRLKKLETAPKPKQMANVGAAWAPYRTIASWYLWRVPR